MKLNLPSAVRSIIGILEDAGYEAYAVGGCVRDLILGRIPQDFDITTNALPQEIKACFRRTIDTGIEHGTVTVMWRGTGYEVTTYRVDGPYKDARHPSSVTFSPHLGEDLRRRDFTVNAMAYHPVRGLVDLFGGMDDLSEGVIRCVGEAQERFEEDALRVLRAYRFAGQLDFLIEEKTRQAARDHAPRLRLISAERIREEMTKLLISPHPEVLRELYEDGIAAVILPEFDRCMRMSQRNGHHLWSVGEHTVRSVMAVRADRVLRWTMLLHDLGKPDAVVCIDGKERFPGHGDTGEKIAENILRRLRFDNRTIRDVTKLVKFHDVRTQPDESSVRHAVYEIGTELFPLYLEVQRADADAKNPEKMGPSYERIDADGVIFRRILERGDPLCLSDLAVSGNDLMDAGIPKGREIGRILNALMDRVLSDPSLNEKGSLLAIAEELL